MISSFAATDPAIVEVALKAHSVSLWDPCQAIIYHNPHPSAAVNSPYFHLKTLDSCCDDSHILPVKHRKELIEISSMASKFSSHYQLRPY